MLYTQKPHYDEAPLDGIAYDHPYCRTVGRSTDWESFLHETPDDVPLLVYYQGGGYDGCHWEWNLGLKFGGEYHDLYSSGRRGCNTWGDVLRFVEEYADYEDMTLIRLTPEVCDDGSVYALHPQVSMWMGFNKWVADQYVIGSEFLVSVPCADCGHLFAINEDTLLTDMHHLGGIAYVNTSALCEGCGMWCEGCNGALKASESYRVWPRYEERAGNVFLSAKAAPQEGDYCQWCWEEKTGMEAAAYPDYRKTQEALEQRYLAREYAQPLPMGVSRV